MSLSQEQQQLKQKFLDGRGVWSSEWENLLKLDTVYFGKYLSLQHAAQGRRRLEPKVQEFVYIAVAACCTHMHAPAVRAHVQAALALGASKEEIMDVIGLTYLVGVHTVTQAFPLLQELLEELGMDDTETSDEEKKERERIKQNFVDKRGFWTDTFNTILEVDHKFFEAYVDFSSLSGQRNVLDPKVRELVTCAFDAATTHLYNRGTKIHMRNALRLGATPGEIVEMLEITSLMGIHGVTLSVPFLASQLDV